MLKANPVRLNAGASTQVFRKRNSFANVSKLVGQMPGAAGGHLETIWGYPENEVNPRESKAKKGTWFDQWTEPWLKLYPSIQTNNSQLHRVHLSQQ